MGIFKNKMNVIILVFFVASILFVLYNLIFNNDTNVGSKIDGITTEEVNIYTTEDYIVHDYITFYNIEQIIQQIILTMSEGKYDELKQVFSDDIVGDISKEQYLELITEFYTSNFSDIKDASGNITKRYVNKMNLNYAYQMDNNIYIAEVLNNVEKKVRIAIKLLDGYKYEIIYVEF